MYHKREYIFVVSLSDGTDYESPSMNRIKKFIDELKVNKADLIVEISQWSNRYLASDWVKVQDLLTFDQQVTVGQLDISKL